MGAVEEVFFDDFLELLELRDFDLLLLRFFEFVVELSMILNFEKALKIISFNEIMNYKFISEF